MSTEADIVERLLVRQFFSDELMAARSEADANLIDKYRAERKEAAAEITKLSAERDAAARALRPFADVVGDLHERAENDDNIWESPAAMNLTAGHLREALYVLSMLPESDAPAGPVIATDGKDAT